MIDKNAKILVAVSGGVDSIYMLHMLVEQGYTNLGVVCFDHMIREESANECEFVALWAGEKYGIEAQSSSVNIEYYAEVKKESVELSARKIRREYFYEVMDEGGYEWLALGQHADDQAETVLFNLMRGSGVHGLAGMLDVDNEQKIFRPLLHLTKTEIYKKAIAANLTWREDHTNQESNYDRNWIRNDIIPQLETRRSGVKKVLAATATRMQDASDYLKSNAQKWFDNYFLGNGDKIHAPHLMMEHKVLRAEILGLVWVYYNGSRTNFNNKVVFEIEKWLSSNPDGGTAVYFGGKNATIRKELLSFIDN